MQLGKKITLFCPKQCYMLFNLTEEFSSIPEFELDERAENRIPILYNGEIKVFDSLRGLNDHLSQTMLEEKTPDIEKKLYKGYLFPANEFSLDSQGKNNITFVIEKISSTICFVEQITSLEEAAKSIQEEINILATNSKYGEDSEPTAITDYMVFHGEPVHLSYYCYDSDV